jgi:hypothetical protein
VEILRPAVRVVMEPALRLIQGDAHQWSENSGSLHSCWAAGYPTKLTEPPIRLGSRNVAEKITRKLLSPSTWRDRLECVIPVWLDEHRRPRAAARAAVQ